MNACVPGARAGQGCCVEAVPAAASPVTSARVKMFSRPRVYPSGVLIPLHLLAKGRMIQKGAFEEKVKFLEAASWDVLCNSTKQVLNFGHYAH